MANTPADPSRAREASLDEAIEESFPASDPPSNTPEMGAQVRPAGGVSDAPERSRFEITIDGLTAFLQYRTHDDTLVLVHTEVPKALGGRGIGGQLVDFAVESAKAKGQRVSALCPFAKKHLEKKAG